MSGDTTGWPLLHERRQGAPSAPRRTAARSRARPAWPLLVLAFVCGGLVAAAGFSIGWRHLAQSGSAAQTRLSAATAHVQKLDTSLAAARGKETQLAAALAAARASTRSLARQASALAAEAADSERAASPLAGDAGSTAATSARVASELKTLSSYLTTTPAAQIDGGYVATQVAYLTRQLDSLQSNGADLGSAAAAFTASVRKLASDATALSRSH